MGPCEYLVRPTDPTSSIAICFLGLSSNLTENTVCLSYAYVVRYFFGRSSNLREHSLSQLCICIQLFLRPQLVCYRDEDCPYYEIRSQNVSRSSCEKSYVV